MIVAPSIFKLRKIKDIFIKDCRTKRGYETTSNASKARLTGGSVNPFVCLL